MRIRLLIALTVVGFASPWFMVANQMQQVAPLAPLAMHGAPSETQNRE